MDKEKTPREKAMGLEEEARKRNYTTPNIKRTKRWEHVKEVAKLYEAAGDEWVKQYSQMTKPYLEKSTKHLLLPLNIRDLKNVLQYAVTDYKTAIKKAPIEESRINKKINSIDKLINNSLSQLEVKKTRLLEDKLFIFITSIVILSASLFFSLYSLTGNAISILHQEDFRWMGLCFFLCGLVFAFFYLKGRK